VEIVSDGAARVRVETDGGEAAEFAAALVRAQVVLMTGTALPSGGELPALRFATSDLTGYEIVGQREGGALVRGSDLVRAAHEILEAWGCRFDRSPPEVARHDRLLLEPVRRPRERELWIDGVRFDPGLPATGFMAIGLGAAEGADLARAKALGFLVGVASTSFDDFLSPALHAEHPEYFALRNGRREARGNFALTHAPARAACLDAVGAWLDAHPEADRLGLWPEVTTVWCEESEALGHAEAYALLWREAAARFPGRVIEILAHGLTLRPPQGGVPPNIRVRLRPGRDASGLQGIEGQPFEAIVRAWEARGARVLLEIDAAPAPWCGMPWPCHEAIRANAARFRSAALRGGSYREARIFCEPEYRPERAPWEGALDVRARTVRSHGDLRDAALLFVDEAVGLPFRVGSVERLLARARDPSLAPDARRAAAADAWFGHRALRRELPPAYATHRARDFAAMLAELLPAGAERRVGPALVRESPSRITVETDLLRLEVDPPSATVVSVARQVGGAWQTPGEGRYFSVVALSPKGDKTGGSVEFEAPDPTTILLRLAGKLGSHGPRFENRLQWRGGSGAVAQSARIDGEERIVAGCRWEGDALDRWVCPAHASEGAVDGKRDLRVAFGMPAGTLLYCRKGEWGLGLAARLPAGGVLSLTGTAQPTLAAVGRGAAVDVEWILFVDPGELRGGPR